MLTNPESLPENFISMDGMVDDAWLVLSPGVVYYTTSPDTYWWVLDKVIKNKVGYIGRVRFVDNTRLLTLRAAPEKQQEAGNVNSDGGLGADN